LAAGRLADAAAEVRTALRTAQELDAHAYSATAYSILSVVELRRGHVDAASRYLTGRSGTGPQFPDLYARSETAFARALVTEAGEGRAAALADLPQLGRAIASRPGSLVVTRPSWRGWRVRRWPRVNSTSPATRLVPPWPRPPLTPTCRPSPRR